MLTVDEAFEVLDKANLPKGTGYAGECGEVAIAINEVLFDGQGELIASANKFLWKHGRFVGHVAVRVGNNVYDAAGVWEDERVPEDLLAWGMLDAEDPDYNLPSEEAGEEVILLENLTPAQVRELLPGYSCPPSLYNKLKKAMKQVRSRRKLKRKLLR